MPAMTLRSLSTRRRIRELWTTGQISALIGVNVKTVTNWIDGGQIRGVTMPGLPDRRVHRSALRAFMNQYGFYWSIAKLDHEEGVITSDQLEEILRGEKPTEPIPDRPAGVASFNGSGAKRNR